MSEWEVFIQVLVGTGLLGLLLLCVFYVVATLIAAVVVELLWVRRLWRWLLSPGRR